MVVVTCRAGLRHRRPVQRCGVVLLSLSRPGRQTVGLLSYILLCTAAVLRPPCMDLLLQGLVLKPQWQTQMGDYVVTEFITCNAVSPLRSKLH